MKKIISLIFVVFALAYNVNAENIDLSMIGFKPIVVTEGLPSNATSYLENQVLNILTDNGIALNSNDFVFEISVNELNKKNTPTSPSRIQMRLEVVIKAIDNRQNIILNSIAMNAAGIDNTESDTYMTVLRSINFRSRNFLNFIDISKHRLEKYYIAGYATSPEDEPVIDTIIVETEYEECEVSDPEPIAEPIIKSIPPQYSPKGIELSNGVFVEYMGVEKKSQTTDIILKFTNYNDKDEIISFRFRSHMVIDVTGRNINSRGEKYLNGDNIPSDGIILLKGVPVSIRVDYWGDIDPQVMFLNEAKRDVKVRIETK